MKQNKRILSLLISLIIILSSFNGVLAKGKTNLSDYNTNASYSFDFINDDEWKTSHREDRLRMCQLPDEYINSASTEALLNTFLAYPFLIDMFAFNTYREGFLSVLGEFNGLEALLKKEDISSALIDAYEKTPVVSNLARNFDERSFRNLRTLEILIVQPEVSELLNDYEIFSIQSIAQEKYENKIEQQSIYGTDVEIFNNSISELTMTPFYTTTYVYTPKGNAVEVYNMGNQQDFAQAQKDFLHNDIKKAYPGISKVSDATVKYNCHSYAWYNRSTSNIYWMDNPSTYMTDGSYTQIANSSNLIGGNIVHYGSGDHSAIYAFSINVPYVESKWGQLGVYIHAFGECPYNLSNLTYWKK